MATYPKRQLVIATIVYVGQILSGYALGWSAPVILKLQDSDQTPLPDVITDGQASWVASSLFIGGFVGPCSASYLSNARGRKPCLVLGGILGALAYLLLALSQNLTMIFVGRILKGLEFSIILVTSFVYIGEIASTNIRGVLLTGTGVFMTMGTLTAYSVGPYTSYAATCYIGLGIAVVYTVLLNFIPESPMFYILQGREDDAKETLKALDREDDSFLFIKPNKEESKGQWKDIFRIKSNRKALTITFILYLAQQMSGIAVVVFFTTTIFELAGSFREPHIATIVIGVTQLVASTITPLFVERIGRKVLLLASIGLCCLSLAILGMYFFLDHLEHDAAASIQWLPLVTLMVYFISYDLGFGIIPGTFVGEMFQSNVRSTGSAVTVSTAWVFGFGVSTSFGYMISAIGAHSTFWIFSGSCALAFLFTALYVPETKGKTLLEIKEMLSN